MRSQSYGRIISRQEGIDGLPTAGPMGASPSCPTCCHLRGLTPRFPAPGQAPTRDRSKFYLLDAAGFERDLTRWPRAGACARFAGTARMTSTPGFAINNIGQPANNIGQPAARDLISIPRSTSQAGLPHFSDNLSINGCFENQFPCSQ